MRRAWLVAGLLVTALLIGVAPASEITVNMLPYAEYGGPGDPNYPFGQTTVFRGLISNPSTLTVIPSIFITDATAKGGASGVFSGFDLDFAILDIDGDLSTTYDQFRPSSAQMVSIGGIRNPSPYQPTSMHPGSLFGLDKNGNVMDVASLGKNDANFAYGNLTVNTSSGWVTIGDGGQIRLNYNNIALRGAQGMYLFLGEVGKKDEYSGGKVTVLEPSRTKTIIMSRGNIGNTYESRTIHGPDLSNPNDPGEAVFIDGSRFGGTSFTWYFEDKNGTDPNNPATWNLYASGAHLNTLYFSYQQLKSLFGYTDYKWYRIHEEISDGINPTWIYDVDIQLTPEPGTMTLMTIGGIGILLDRRRRRKGQNKALPAVQTT